MVKVIKNNIHKILIFSMLILSFCLVFAGCNLSNNTPSGDSVEVITQTLSSPQLAQGLVKISKSEYEAIPNGQKPTLYNESGAKVTTSLNWANEYCVYSPFSECEEGKYILTVKNYDASHTRGYIFYVFSGEVELDANNQPLYNSNFTEHISLKTATTQNTYYMYDVTSFINSPKTYYFGVQALGVGHVTVKGQKYNFLDSSKSLICSFTKTGNLSFLCDEVEAEGTQVSWPKVDNVKNYEVYYSTNNSSFNKIATTTLTTINLSEISGFTAPTGTYYIKIKAVGKDYYIFKEFNSIILTNIVQLSTPTNLAVDGSFKATWNSIENASKYELTLVSPSGSSEIIETASNSCDLSGKITIIGKYYLKVKAVGNENLEGDTTVFSSLYSDYVPFIKTETLAKPSGLKFDFSGNNVELSWNAVSKAQSYSIYLKVDSKYIVYNGNCTLTKYTIALKDIVRDLLLEGKLEEGKKFDKFTISVKANGYDYYLASSYSDTEVLNKVNNEGKLETPTNITQMGNNLVWDTVPFAEKYLIKVYNSESTEGELIYNNYTPNPYFNLALLKNVNSKNLIQITADSSIYINSNVASYYYIIYNQLQAVNSVSLEEKSKGLLLQWLDVENANTYSVRLDLSKSTPEENLDLALSENIVTLTDSLKAVNGVVQYELLHTDLLTACENNKYLSYYLYIVCNGYDIFLASDEVVVTYNNKTLSALILKEHNGVISWDGIDDVDYYNLYLNNELIQKISNTQTQIDISNYLKETALYEFRIEACSSFFINSNSTIVVDYNAGRLQAPTIYIVNDVLKWDSVDEAQYYELYIDGELIEDNLLVTSYDLKTVCTESKSYNIVLKAKAAYKEESQSSITYNNDEEIESLQITSTAPESYIIEFDNVNYADYYDVYLNNTLVETINSPRGTTISYNYQNKLNNFKSTYTGDAVSITVCAKNNTYNTVNFSNSLFVYTKNQNANEYYYVFDNYYDNYIDSFKELIYVNLYAAIFEIEVNLVLNYAYQSIETEINSASEEAYKFLASIWLTRSYSYNENNVTISYMNNYSPIKTYSTGYTKGQNNPLWSNFVPQEVRGESLIKSDSNAISLRVENSDMLYWALQFGARPVFSNSQASQNCKNYYERAKAILNSILPNNATDYDKAYILAEYILANSWYDYSYNLVGSQYEKDVRFHFLEGFFEDGLVVCDGYAKIYSLLCNMEGIKNYVISGLADKYDKNSGHAWNKIYLDIDGFNEEYSPNWYFVDLTGCDGVTLDDLNIFTHKYFLLSDNNELITNRLTYSNYYPTASSNFDYYKSNFNKLKQNLHSSMYAGSGQTQLENFLTTIIYAMYEEGETSIDVKYSVSLYTYLDSAIEKISNNLLNNFGINIGVGGANELTYASFASGNGSENILLLTLKI